MILKINTVRAVVKVHVQVNFIELSAVVHELSCTQRKNSNENNTVVATVDSKNANNQLNSIIL